MFMFHSRSHLVTIPIKNLSQTIVLIAETVDFIQLAIGRVVFQEECINW